MELRLTLFLVLCCMTLDTGWCIDQDEQSLVDLLERSNATDFTVTTAGIVYHMELDLHKPCHPNTRTCNNVIYLDKNSLKTTDVTSSTTIAGNTTKSGYKEGIGSEALFSEPLGFIQLTDQRVIVADKSNRCLREINRDTKATSQFAGQCGQSGQFQSPWSVMRDKNDDMQLLVTDWSERAVKTVDITSGVVGTFVQANILLGIQELTQNENGDLYVIVREALYHINYKEKIITLISGTVSVSGYRDSSLLNSLFSSPNGLLFIINQTLLVADEGNKKIRLVDLTTDRVSTLDLCSGCLDNPVTLFITNHSLYIGQKRRIQQFMYRTRLTTPTTTTTIPTTTTQTTTSRAPCPDSGMIFFVTSDEEKAFVDTGPDQQTGFAVGSFVIYKGNCTINFIVINNATKMDMTRTLVTLPGGMQRSSTAKSSSYVTPEPQSTEEGNPALTAGELAQQFGISNLNVAIISSAVGIIVVISVLVFAAYVIRLRTITNQRHESSVGGTRRNRGNQSGQEISQDETCSD